VDILDLALECDIRFQRLGNIADLDMAILNITRAVDLTSDGHKYQAESHARLSTALKTRFDQLGDLSDLENAILNIQKAVDLTPNGHVDLPKYINNLAFTQNIRFRQLGDLSDLDKAISNHQKAVDLTPNGHPMQLMPICHLYAASALALINCMICLILMMPS
jgi:tetratricopeptide (TPR) repeat protein